MLHFTLRRLTETLLLLLLVSVLVFALFEAIPGDYLSEMELNPSVSRERIEQLRQSYGLSQPFYIQYFIWLGELAKGNLGYSFAQQRPAVDLILERAGNTILLAASVLIVTLLISVPLGVSAALQAGRWPDRIILVFSLIGLSFPSLLLALGFLLFAFRTGWFPLGGTGGISHLVLPTLTLSLPVSAFFVRSLRLEMMDSLQKPFILAAAARGIRSSRLVLHALRNAVNPLISLTGILAGSLLSGAVVVEKVFDWPGLGALMVDSILYRDLFVVLNCVLASALLIVLANLVADLVLAWNDPRVRYQ